MSAEKAPNFSLESDSGTKVSLGDFRGKTLVLYFYPKDDTPGCTREAIAFTKALLAFKKAGAQVVGVSKDSTASHAKFRDKYSLKIPLLSDTDLSVHKAYGAFGEKTMYGKKKMGVIRSTFIIKDGRIVRAWKGVKVDGHDENVLAALAEDGAPEESAVTKKKTSTTRNVVKAKKTKK